jgi:hypothetical protein
MRNTTRLKEPINQIKNKLNTGVERTSTKSQVQESLDICWGCGTRQNGKLLQSRENAQLEQSSEDHVALESGNLQHANASQYDIILNISSQQASKAYAHLPQELNLVPFMICTAVHVEFDAGKPPVP